MNKNNNISAMKEECERILCKFGTPSHVIEHCKAVCEVATAIGNRLNESNKIDSKINIELLFYSAMLHDIARVHENHEEVGADYLQELGLVSRLYVCTLILSLQHYQLFHLKQQFLGLIGS